MARSARSQFYGTFTRPASGAQTSDERLVPAVHAKVEVHRIFVAALLVLLTGGTIPGRVECMTNGRQAEDNGVGAYPQA